jgi:hypothetical protein
MSRSVLDASTVPARCGPGSKTVQNGFFWDKLDTVILLPGEVAGPSSANVKPTSKLSSGFTFHVVQGAAFLLY